MVKVMFGYTNIKLSWCCDSQWSRASKKGEET